MSHRAGQQRVSTVYEDAGSEHTDSFVTARSDSEDDEDAENAMVAPNHDAPAGPSNSATLSATKQPGSKLDPDGATEGTTTLMATLPGNSNVGGSGFGDGSGSSNNAFGPVPPARPRPRRRAPISGSSNSSSGSEGSIWRRWTRELSSGDSRISRPSFSAAHCAIKSRLPPLPILLFWAGFLAPWCWLIGGWLVAEGRWEDNGKARAALPLWKPRPNPNRGAAAGKRPRGLRGGGEGDAGVGGGVWGKETASVPDRPQLPFDPFAKDVEQGDAEETAVVAGVTAQERQAGAGAGAGAGARARAGAGRRKGRGGQASGDPVGGPREWWFWIPCAGGNSFTRLRHDSESGTAGAVPSSLTTGPGPGPGPSPNSQKVVTLVKPYSAEVWVYRCRVAAVLSALVLLTALIVSLVVIKSTSS